MGPKNSQPIKQDQNPKINHPRFNAARFIKSAEDENIIEIKLPIANEKQYTQWANKLKSLPADKQPFLFPIQHAFKKQGMCGSSGFATVQYETFPFLLADQINNRKSLKQKFFDEPELWYLVYTLITAGHEFHQNDEKVGDVRPENVFINEQGQVKVGTQYTWPSQSVNYHKTFYEKQLTYLSPEQLKDIVFAKVQPTCNKKLAESFSIGLTCLDAGTLGNSSSLFLKNNKFDYEGLQSRLGYLQQIRYSQLLVSVIKSLCEVDVDNRITCSQLYHWLKNYQQPIINLEHFEADHLPQKLQVNRGGTSPQRVRYQNSVKINSQQQNIGQPQSWQQGQNWQQIQNRQVINPNSYTQTRQYRQTTSNQEPIRMQSQPNTVNSYSYTPNQNVTRTYVVSEQQKQQYMIPNQQRVQQNGPITSQTFTSSNYTPVVNQGGEQVQTRTMTYTHNYSYSPNAVNMEGQSPERDQNRSNMQKTLSKIDQQLQMSRKMFPS